MTTSAAETPPHRTGGIPRGLATTGPALLSYGFRPFFLAAGLYAFVAMALWIFALTDGLNVGGTTYGPVAWHGHEMLFGYTTAALAGFLLTAVPNWTGRLPVSGTPLLLLFGLWLLGRIAMLQPDLINPAMAAAVDAAFLPVLAATVGREVVRGRNWKNLKVLVAVVLLALLNGWSHLGVLAGIGEALPFRLTIAVYVTLVAIVGGRIIPSFTRNYLARSGARSLPSPFDRWDVFAIAVLAAAAILWAVLPDAPPVAIPAVIAALINGFRLYRWRGGGTLDEPLVAVLHASYAFLPIGLLMAALGALGWVSPVSTMHVLTVGVIGLMTLAVMTRASRGHTGNALNASPATLISYLALMLAALVRPFAEILPDQYHLLLAVSGAAWLVAFGLYVVEYGPMLVRPRREKAAR